ncbi:peptide-methionine (S)-S-oxide reductase MsrA [Haloarchaeobius sp. DYHT-AS-18]|uniref:peptide-methionine (S)-S-oxide reductase MsrA n=1 Tax=Haloarchaeobius sp. DYHT-AS-18 TaxID=3446117 RepID=UPI003EBEA59B
MTRHARGASALPSTALPLDAAATSETETATFGLGCFWGPDARLGVRPGVVRTRVGYAGGSTPSPTYRDLGDHTEVVQVDYNPTATSYRDLLDWFFQAHNPRANSPIRQYDNLVLWHDEAQREAVEAAVAEREARRGRLTTRAEPLDSFTVAEHYHQKYRLRSAPAVFDALAATYNDAAIRESTVAARLNGLVAGYGSLALLDDEGGEFGLPEDLLARLRDRLE